MNSDWKVFAAEEAEYPAMLAFVQSAAEACGVPQARMLRLELGFEEAVVNIIHYAYDKGYMGKLWLYAGREGKDFILKLADEGQPFNPLDKPDALHGPQPKSVEESKVGGLGIAFIRRSFDDVGYCYQSLDGLNKNILTLCLHL